MLVAVACERGELQGTRDGRAFFLKIMALPEFGKYNPALLISGVCVDFKKRMRGVVKILLFYFLTFCFLLEF